MAIHNNSKIGGLNIRIGCDIVEIKRFKNLGREPLHKIFHESEIRNAKPETLAGLFAAKESCKKVFNQLRWHDILIQKLSGEKPVLRIQKPFLKNNLKMLSCDLSISHDRSYAIATAVFLIADKGKRTGKS
ncbi:4'-phosphopantetheinyl transferase superfamily protein [Candidatus Woesearchaeota archaeon]|nr:4'-phosphopantetheinyl transferase superfamily protein [Candidatus Woesearchaeota archaeon]